MRQIWCRRAIMFDINRKCRANTKNISDTWKDSPSHHHLGSLIESLRPGPHGQGYILNIRRKSYHIPYNDNKVKLTVLQEFLGTDVSLTQCTSFLGRCTRVCGHYFFLTFYQYQAINNRNKSTDWFLLSLKRSVPLHLPALFSALPLKRDFIPHISQGCIS